MPCGLLRPGVNPDLAPPAFACAISSSSYSERLGGGGGESAEAPRAGLEWLLWTLVDGAGLLGSGLFELLWLPRRGLRLRLWLRFALADFLSGRAFREGRGLGLRAVSFLGCVLFFFRPRR